VNYIADIEIYVFHPKVLVKQYRDKIGDPTVHLTTLLIGSVFFVGLKMTR